MYFQSNREILHAAAYCMGRCWYFSYKGTMNKAFQAAFLLSFFISPSVLAIKPVIYGIDNRVEVSESSALQQKLAASAATMISETKLSRDPLRPGLVQIQQTSLMEWLESPVQDKNVSKLFSPKIVEAAKAGMKFCENERFIDQPNPGMCSGFLIAPDLIMTAGHCAALTDFCSEYRWVFGFEVDAMTKKAGVDVKEEDIYSCKKVVSTALNTSLGFDYAILLLDRKVTSRKPLEMRIDQKIPDGSNLVIIGSPSGLPLKVSAGANVRDNQHPFYFNANLDSFQGNSGSAVFNAETGIVEGILVRGEEDFFLNSQKMCIQANSCTDDGCRGEDVTRLTAIPEVALKSVFNRAAMNGDMANLEKILKLNFWIDFYGQDGVTALMNAIKGGKQKGVEALVAKGANVNLQDVNGNTALHHLGLNLNKKIIPILTTLLKSQADLELKNTLGETPLNKAASHLNLIGVKLLMENGSYKNSTNSKGETVLFAFARRGNFLAIKELIDLGVDASIKNADGLSYLEINKSFKAK